MNEIGLDDFLNMAGDNVYDTEYSHKLSISCKHTTYRMFKELKDKLKRMDIKVNNAQLFEYMVVELYNSNLNSLQ
jgi:ribosomal protein S4